MSKVPLSEHQRQALREFTGRAAERAQLEEKLKSGYAARKSAAEEEHDRSRHEIERTFQAAKNAADARHRELHERITAQCDADEKAAAQEHGRIKHQSSYTYTTNRDQTLAEYKETRWSLGTIYDSDKKVADEHYARTKDQIAAAGAKIDEYVAQALAYIDKWQLGDRDPATEKFEVAAAEPFAGMQLCLTDTAKKLAELQAFTLPVFLRSIKFPLLWVLLWVAVTAPAFLISQWYIWVAGTTLGVIISAWFVKRRLTRAAHEKISAMFQPIRQAAVEIRGLQEQCRTVARATHRQERADAKTKYQTSLKEATLACKKKLRELARVRDQITKKASKEYASKTREISGRRAAEIEKADSAYKSYIARITARHDNDLANAAARFQSANNENESLHAARWAELTESWRTAAEAFRDVVRRVDRENHRLFPEWENNAWKVWQPQTGVPLGIRFGELGVRTARIPHGNPNDPSLPSAELDGLSFPALLPFPRVGSLLLKTHEDGRTPAVQLLQALMLRFLTAIPPGKTRFTIFDPVGRGENFAAFMHLADYDELLITSRIWTEPGHLEQRLTDLTDHMENVIQKYLRNQFETLEDYNAQAGEVAEPYRILVVANFPVNFSPTAARRLVSLATSGARCGVYTLISVDTKQQLPQGFDLADLEEACLTLEWRDQKFRWIDPDFCAFPLKLEAPPADAFCTEVLNTVGARAREAGRVEVPFDGVAPRREQWWKGSTAKGISVALGRAGAVKSQNLELGRGTAQHVLIAGKTGSGKSTLLHVLITQLALVYSPDEIELYLVDFKKGVEFKTYATHRLPHARVVAVESEREFGLSVLQRLDSELKRRGEIFRNLGIAELSAYREIANQPPLPRIMLIVDEFQEFFVEDDRIAQDSSLLMDRLVRQGRAFGIHIMLGSQTLGGAYSLARSTIDQMAVRVALQCSETDAHFILSKDNSAARLLTRPGEAIYNAANGNPEANNFFQIVWLEDERRDELLEEVAQLAEQRRYVPPAPQIVFEGTAPSDLLCNPLVSRWLEDGEPVFPATERRGQAVQPNAWLGEAIAIKEPTTATFARQSGANLLIVGQNADIAFSLMVSSLISLVTQYPAPEMPAVSLVVGTQLDARSEDVFTHLPALFSRHVEVVAQRDLPLCLNRLSEELNRRSSGGGTNQPLFLFLYGLQRLRDLRQEENFGFMRRDDSKPASPAEQFLTLLREGPNVGIFTIAWCDTVNNLNRSVERQTLREFEMRVLFQMNAGDSSHLIDNPLASKLGVHRALFYSDDQGKLEKFRPYALPTLEALTQISSRLPQSTAAVSR